MMLTGNVTGLLPLLFSLWLPGLAFSWRFHFYIHGRTLGPGDFASTAAHAAGLGRDFFLLIDLGGNPSFNVFCFVHHYLFVLC